MSRRDADASGGDSVTGYLYVSNDLPWPNHPLTSSRLQALTSTEGGPAIGFYFLPIDDDAPRRMRCATDENRL